MRQRRVRAASHVDAGSSWPETHPAHAAWLRGVSRACQHQQGTNGSPEGREERTDMRRRAGSVGGSRAFERSAYRRCCRRCWPTNSERGRRGPRQRKHPLRSPARERRAAGAAAPGEADERRQRPLDNLRPTGAARQQVATSGREARARGGSGSGGRHPPRSGASAWPRLGARGRAPRREMRNSRDASGEFCSIYRI